MYHSLYALLGLSLTLAAHGAAVGSSHPLKQPKAVYFMTNAADNAVVALPVKPNGQLADGSITPTGGKGLNTVNAMTGQPNLIDGTNSQGSVRVTGQVALPMNPHRSPS